MDDNIVLLNDITIDEYLETRKSVNWDGLDRTQAEEILKKSVYTVIARQNNELLGMARVVGDGIYYFLIVDVIVKEEYRGQGIGSRLIENILDILRKKCTDNRKISIQLFSAKGREGFYEKFGFIKRPNDNLGCGMSMFL